MLKRIIEFFIVDLLLAVDKIKRYAADIKKLDEFVRNEQVVDSVLREFEIIGEAAKYILEWQEVKEFVPPHWRAIVNFRNIITHEYFGIKYEEVFKIIKNNIPELESEAVQIINKIKDKKELFNAIKKIKEEQEKLGRKEALSYLISLENRLK